MAGSDAEAVAWVTGAELDAYGVNAHAAAVIRKGLEVRSRPEPSPEASSPSLNPYIPP